MTKTTTFVWDPVFDCVISELDGSNNVQAVYTNEPQQYGGVISQRRGTTTSTLHADALGTTRALTDSTETVTDTYLYDSWGNEAASTGTTLNPFRWIGRYGYYHDVSTGQVYVRARMYQPTVARWICKDPLIPNGLKAIFVYVRNSPIWLTDPSGLIDDFPSYFPPYLNPNIFNTPPFLPGLPEPTVTLPPWDGLPPLPDPQFDPLSKVDLCDDKTTWTKADCPCPSRSTKIGKAPVSDKIYAEEFQNALKKLGVSIGVTVDVKDICIPGFPGISVTCPANMTKSGKLVVCLAKGSYNNSDAAALALHEAVHVLQIQNGQPGNEKQAYRKQCEELYEQACCDSPCPDARGCYGPPFMKPPRKPNDPIPDKNSLIDGCVQSLLPQSTGAANQQAFQTFCGQN